MDQNQTQNQQLDMSELFADYEARKAKGHIFWTVSPEGTAVANFRRFDLAHNEIEPPFQMKVSGIQIEKLKIAVKQQVNQLETEKLDLEERIQKLKGEVKHGWVSAIAKDVQETEKSVEE